MATALRTLVVIARLGHIPIMEIISGFSVVIPLLKTDPKVFV